MIELAFVACLVSSLEICEDQRLVFVEASAERCLSMAQPELARWANSHSGWRIKRWTCRSVARQERDA